MNEDRFNMTLRQFLKEVGVTSQREIEKAVRDAVNAGTLTGDERLIATMRLEVPGIGLTHVVERPIEL